MKLNRRDGWTIPAGNRGQCVQTFTFCLAVFHSFVIMV